MLTNSKREKLKKQPKWVQELVDDLEKELEKAKKIIRILNKKEYDSNIWVQTDGDKGFYLNNNAKIKFKDGISIIEVYLDNKQRNLVVQGHTCIKVLPRAWNSIRVKSEEY